MKTKKVINSINGILIKAIVIVIAQSVFFPSALMCQQPELIYVDNEIKYFSKNDSKILSLTMSYEKDDQRYVLKNREVRFFAGDNLEMELGRVFSNYLGQAIMIFNSGLGLPVNEEGKTHFTAIFPGDDNFEESSGELDIKEVFMKMSLEETDGVKTVTVKVTKTDQNGEVVAVIDEEVLVFVPRMYSDLQVGEIWLDEYEEQGSVEFPEDIPGNINGDINIIAKIVDHDEYGNVEIFQESDWGVSLIYDSKTMERALWLEDAPLWMTITLFVFLAGVWFHFIRVFFRMYKIKKDLK